MTPDEIQFYLWIFSIVTGIGGAIAGFIHMAQSSRPSIPKPSHPYQRS